MSAYIQYQTILAYGHISKTRGRLVMVNRSNVRTKPSHVRQILQVVDRQIQTDLNICEWSIDWCGCLETKFANWGLSERNPKPFFQIGCLVRYSAKCTDRCFNIQVK